MGHAICHDPLEYKLFITSILGCCFVCTSLTCDVCFALSMVVSITNGLLYHVQGDGKEDLMCYCGQLNGLW